MEIPKFIKGIAKYFTYASDSGETTPTTQADLQELMKNNNTILECLVDGLWQPEKEMQLNQIIRSPNMPANMVAKVTNVGTTGTIEPEWTEMPDTSVSDGSVTFIMCPLIFSIATQAEAEAGTNNTEIMTPLRTKQLIKISLPNIATQAEAEAGTDNTKMMTPLRTNQAIEAQDGNPIVSASVAGRVITFTKKDGSISTITTQDTTTTNIASITPNYNAGVSVGTSFTAPNIGWILGYFNISGETGSYAYVNNKVIAYEWGDIASVQILVNQGDVFYTTGTSRNLTFYPCKGA